MDDFPDIALSEQLGATSSNICWDFCLQFLGRSWATIQGCGASPDEATDAVTAYVAKLNTTAQAMGYPPNCITFISGACPA